ncbi:Ras-related protein Rab-4, partial [Stegodyphus mimosarum]
MMKNRELGDDVFFGIDDEKKESEMQFPSYLCDMAVEELLEASTSENFAFLENMDIDASLKFMCHSMSLENILFYDMVLRRPKCEKNLKLLRRFCSGNPKYLRNTKQSGGNTCSQNAIPYCLKFFNGSLIPIYHIFNVIFVGNKAVGTTSILRRILKNTYKEEYKSTYIHSFERTMDFGKTKCIIEFCDTGGDLVLQGVIASYTQRADVVVTVYDVTNGESFRCAKKWISYIKERNRKNASIFVIGTKKDRQKSKRVPRINAELIAKENNAFFYECSSRTGEGITEIKDAFFRILKSKTEGN